MSNTLNSPETSPNRSMIHATRPGFSMLELVGVLVIIGLLLAGAAVAVPAQIERAKIKITKTSMETIKSQIESYRAENGDPPQTLQVLIPSYMETGSDIDSFDRPFFYTPTPNSPQKYSLISSGPDREINTDDDIDLWTMDRE